MRFKKIILGGALVALTAYETKALIFPDVALIAVLERQHREAEASKWYQHGAKITEMINQIRAIQNLTQNFTDYRAYIEVINGKWAQKIPGMERIGTLLNRDTPGDLRNLGWDLELFDRVVHLRSKGAALRELRSVLDAEASRRGLSQMRESIEEIYGEVPVTAEGVPVEAAYREMATVTAQVGESTKAIEENREEISALLEEIESGELAPGDIERMSAVLGAKQIELSILQTAAINNATRASVQQLGLAATERRERVQAAITDRQSRIRMAQNLHFGLDASREEGVE